MDSFPLGNLCHWPAAVVMLALAACTTVGLDYQPPDDTWLTGLEESVYGVSVTLTPEGGQDLSNWWQQFEDPILDSLIEGKIIKLCELIFVKEVSQI